MSQNRMQLRQLDAAAQPEVLVIDDEAEVRSVLRRVLERAGFTVTEAAGGEEAVGLLEEGFAPDAIVCDVLMPTSWSGVEVHRILIERFPGLADSVIFLSGVSEEVALQHAIDGAPLYSKLDDLQLVVDAIRLAVRRSQVRRAATPR